MADSDRPSRPPSSPLVARAALTAGFVALTAGFHFLQPYRALFFSQEALPQLAYLAARLVFALYFFAIVLSLGHLVVRLAGGPRRLGLSEIEQVALSLLCGSAVLRIGMLGLGFAGLYQWWLLAALSALLLWFGLPNILMLARSIGDEARRGLEAFVPDRLARLSISAALAAGCLAVVAYKFLLPNGTGDYFSHYLPYYQVVTERGDIWPNEVWYHFYVSKGAGDTFLAIILSDLLGPLTVSCTMFFAALATMYALVRRGTDDALVALAATALAASGMIWTVETAIGFRFWAEFAKEHVTSAVLFFGCSWAVWRYRTVPAEARGTWSALTALGFVGLVVLRIQFGAISLMLVGLYTIGALVARDRREVLHRIVPAIAIGVAALGLLVLNYAITGLAEVTPFRTFWRLADQARFAEWVSPFLMLLLELGSSADLGSIAPPDLSQFPAVTLLLALFRLDRLAPLLWPYGIPLVLATLAAILLAWRSPVARRFLKHSHAGLCLAVILSGALLFMSVNQLGSLYRIYMFLMFPVIALGVVPFAAARAVTGEYLRPSFGLLLAVPVLAAPVSEALKIPAEERVLTGRFLVGQANLAEVYAASNAVWPAGVKMSELVEPGAPIWNSQVGWHFCIAPVCNFQSFFSFNMGNQWATVMFDQPAAAKAALQKNHLDYFAVDTASPFFDLLPYSSLFRPDVIADHFGLLWTDGTVFLLTWRSDRTKPLTREFLDGYAKSIAAAEKFADFRELHARLAGIHSRWQVDKRWPVKIDESLPRVRGWQ